MKFYHVTTLSNFVRGYDRYGRSYGKEAISESTFPNQFFLLDYAELDQGLRKAERLIRKVAIEGDRPVLIKTDLDLSQTLNDHASGVGCYTPQPRISVAGVSWINREADGGHRIEDATVEDIMAEGLRVTAEVLHPWEACRPRTVSVLPIAHACQASCRFCFSKASVSNDYRGKIRDWSKIDAAFRAGAAAGAERAVITGGGEPMLLRDEVMDRLISTAAAHFDKVVLITNGSRIGENEEVAARRLEQLADAGLSVLSISRHHHKRDEAARIMGIDVDIEVIARAASRAERSPDLRLICVLQKEGIETSEQVSDFLSWSGSLGVDQVTFKELYISTTTESAYADLEANRFSARMQAPLSIVTELAADRGYAVDYNLPWGAPVYTGRIGGCDMRFAAYTEPSVHWERSNGIVRSWNLMASGQLLASLEDSNSEVYPDEFL